ncbi:MAG: glycosyltransferase [Fibrobacter sp.]|nr:glycosyltransferase [Fibrobacter sp.]
MNSVHVVLCTYNGERFLEEMLRSIVSQTIPPKTVTILDDASTDNTTGIVEKFSEILPLHFHKNQKNSGHRAAFSKALEYARPFVEPGDFIALADQDDIWEPTKNETLLKEIGDAALAFGDAQIIDGDGKKTADSWRAQAHISKVTNIDRQVAGINNVTGMISLFRGELLEKILPIPEGVTVHDRWIAMMALKNGGVKAIDQVVAKYRIHGNNAVGGAATPCMSETLKTAISWNETILANSQRLEMTPGEIAFAKRHLAWSRRKLNCATALRDLPWVFAHRNDLFLKTSAVTRLKQILFSGLGLSLARKLFGKS